MKTQIRNEQFMINCNAVLQFNGTKIKVPFVLKYYNFYTVLYLYKKTVKRES